MLKKGGADWPLLPSLAPPLSWDCCPSRLSSVGDLGFGIVARAQCGHLRHWAARFVVDGGRPVAVGGHRFAFGVRSGFEFVDCRTCGDLGRVVRIPSRVQRSQDRLWRGWSQPGDRRNGWSKTKDGDHTVWFWPERWSQIWGKVWGVIW